MANMTNEDWVWGCHDGVVTVPLVADRFHVTQAWTREWCEANAVPRAGNSYALLLEHVDRIQEELEDEADEEEEEEEPEDEADAEDEEDCDEEDEAIA